MSNAFVFPGQGSQAVGMGRALAEAFPVARETFEEVDDALGQKLGRLMAEGPESDLILTENAQPALMAVSRAALRVLASEGNLRLADKVAFVAGHSLGEYSALAAAGALALADAARLLKRRGRAMQQAVPVGEGAMAALLGLDLAAAVEIAAAAAADIGGGAVCAADNVPDTPYLEPAASCPNVPANGCWYLGRAQNSCGNSSYADGSQTPPHPLDGVMSPCP